MSRTTNAVAVSAIGIDTGKNTLHLIGLHERGTIVLREKLPRGRIGGPLANVPPCLIGIEAGMGTHYVARELMSLGHDVRQVPPVYAKPLRQTHKNDFRDACAIAEAPSAQVSGGDGGVPFHVSCGSLSDIRKPPSYFRFTRKRKSLSTVLMSAWCQKETSGYSPSYFDGRPGVSHTSSWCYGLFAKPEKIQPIVQQIKKR